MRKRFLPLGFVAAILITLCSGVAFASEARASKTLTRYNAIALSGDNKGEIKISYDVMASGEADRVGVSSIEIYEEDDTYVTTITGTLANGLLRANAGRHISTYTYKGTSGVTYYAKVTVYAKIGSDSDSRTVETNTATAP